MVKNSKGYTLIELMIVIALFGIVTSAIAMGQYRQTNKQKNMDLESEMHQNMRAALYHMENELLLAGFDPDGAANESSQGREVPTGIITQGLNNIEFTYMAGNDGDDNDGDGTTDEENEVTTIEYALSTTLASNGSKDIERSVNGVDYETVASNIQDMEFEYISGADSRLTVRVTILGRTSSELKGIDDQQRSFEMPSGTLNFNDKYGRRMIALTVKCRNLLL